MQSLKALQLRRRRPRPEGRVQTDGQRLRRAADPGHGRRGSRPAPAQRRDAAGRYRRRDRSDQRPPPRAVPCRDSASGFHRGLPRGRHHHGRPDPALEAPDHRYARREKTTRATNSSSLSTTCVRPPANRSTNWTVLSPLLLGFSDFFAISALSAISDRFLSR